LFDLGDGFGLAVFYDADLDKYADYTCGPDVAISLHIDSQCCGPRLTLEFTGSLGEQNVERLISELTKGLEQARAAAKKRGYYHYLEHGDEDDDDAPPMEGVEPRLEE